WTWWVSIIYCCFFFSSRRRHTRSDRDWSSDVCSSDLRIFRSAALFRLPRFTNDYCDPRISHEQSRRAKDPVRELEEAVSALTWRSEERRVGKECGCRWSRGCKKQRISRVTNGYLATSR